MYLTGICWSCAVVILVQGVLADIPESKDEHYESQTGYDQRPEEWPRIFPQKWLGSKVIETSTNTFYHPKITQAPILRRKLGSNKWDAVHEGIQGQKRDATSCPSDYQLCPQSVNGGCCPNDRVCGSSSCYAAGAAPVSACGKVGYIACGIDDGGKYPIYGGISMLD